MRYVSPENKICSLTEVRKANPNVSIPEGADCSDLGYATLIETPMPEAEAGFQWVMDTPVNNTVTWKKVAIDPIRAESDVRIERNLLLKQSDWTQVADAPVDQAAWATYRQALRDVPDQEGFPFIIDWPSKPE